MKTKVCSKCGQEKSVEEFYAHSTAKDGLQPYCKYCQKEVAQNRVSEPKVKIKPEALAGVNKRPVFREDNPLSLYTPRELMQELYNRGYEGELTYTTRINIAKM